MRLTDDGREELERKHTRLQVVNEGQRPELAIFLHHTKHSINIFAFFKVFSSPHETTPWAQIPKSVVKSTR